VGSITEVKVQLLKGSSVISTLVASTANDGSQSFTLPFDVVPGSDYVIRLTDTTNAMVTDDSEPFTVRAPFLAVTSPNGGETIIAGSSVNIQWTGDKNLLGKVSITLWQNERLISTLTSSTANDGSYIWSTSMTLAAGSGYSIRITPVSHTAFYDDSDAPFSVRKAVLKVTSPTTGASYARLMTVTISWQKEAANIGQIKIELYKNGALSRVIVSTTANDGSYSWRIPTGVTAGDYQIKISSISDPTIYAWSGVFNIR
jgi:hypothetical protein